MHGGNDIPKINFFETNTQLAIVVGGRVGFAAFCFRKLIVLAPLLSRIPKEISTPTCRER